MSYHSTTGIQPTFFLSPKQADLLVSAGLLLPEHITITQPIPDTPESTRNAESRTPKGSLETR